MRLKLESPFFPSAIYAIVAVVAVLFTVALHAYGMFERGQGGHDTFQYILWAELIATDKPLLVFYRPALYGILYGFYAVFGWKDWVLSLCLVTFSTVSLIAIALIVLKTEFSTVVKCLVILTVALMRPFWLGDQANYISGIEYGLFYAALALLLVWNPGPPLRAIVPVSRWRDVLVGILFYLLIHVHEEKVILIALIIVYLFFFHSRRVAVTIALTTGFLSIVTALYFGPITTLNSLLSMRHSISSNWPYEGLILTNGTKLLALMLSVGFSLKFIELVGLAYAACVAFTRSFDLKIGQRVLVDLVAILVVYFILIGAAMGQVGLERIFYFALPLFAIGAGYVIEGVTRPLPRPLAAVIAAAIFAFQLVPTEREAYVELKRPVVPVPARIAFDYLQPRVGPNDRILMGESFDDRLAMWDGYEAYSLQSKVYFGQQARAIVNLGNTSSPNHGTSDSPDRYSYFVVNKRGGGEKLNRDLDVADKYFGGRDSGTEIGALIVYKNPN